jgi:cytochrome c5
MSNHAPKADPIAKIIFLISLLAILAVVYILVSNLISTYKRNSTKGEIDTTQLILNAEENLKPIGLSSLSGAPVIGAAGRAGKEIYDAVCTSCHATGVLGSPKFGDNAAWSARAKGGLESLLASATNGKGSMPAKGGDPSITDSELKAVILYMTKEAGLDLGGAVEDKKEAAAVETPKKEEAKTEKKAAEKPAIAVAPEKTPESQPAPVVPAAPVVTAAPVAAAAPKAPSIDGKKVYDSACFACHASGVAGSPKLGDKAAWAPRIATGIDNLYHTALNGKGAMPPKGGNMALADDKVKAAVDYMVGQAQ